MINYLLNYLTSWKQRKDYEENIYKSRISSVIINLLSATIDTSLPRVKHPFHHKKLEEYKNNVGYWLDGREVNINFGDSLTDLSRKEISLCHDGIFSISGSWSHHIQTMAEDMKDALKRFIIKNISIGCLGGNPLLVYQNYNEIVTDAINCLNKVRELYPDSRIIVYGLPPVYNIHVVENTYQFDSELIKWVEKDKDAKFINLKSHFGNGFAKLFPSVNWSSDGVHFNPNGGLKFSNLIKKEQR
jgi:hypothetical protein